MQTITIEQRKTHPRYRSWVRDMAAGTFVDVKLPRGVQQGPVRLDLADGLYQFKEQPSGDKGYYLVNGRLTRIDSGTVAYEVLRDLPLYLAGRPVPPEPNKDGLKMRLTKGASTPWAARIEGMDGSDFDWTFLRAAAGGPRFRDYYLAHDGLYVSKDQRGMRYWELKSGALDELNRADVAILLQGGDCPF